MLPFPDPSPSPLAVMLTPSSLRSAYPDVDPCDQFVLFPVGLYSVIVVGVARIGTGNRHGTRPVTASKPEMTVPSDPFMPAFCTGVVAYGNVLQRWR